MLAVAQLVERRVVVPNVVGSSPISHPNYYIPVNQVKHTVSIIVRVGHLPAGYATEV